MKIKILSHAGLLLQTQNTSIIVDPWLIGSCYWRSWWNFPEPEVSPEEIRQVDAIVISHIHWDHWHGPTLKKFFKGKPVYVPDEPSLRSEKDLRSIGFDKVYRVKHADPIQVGDITLTMYQFGLFLNDAAIVIEAGGVRLLNANDAKIAGWALRHLLSQHGRFDFALRSHSSANARICYKIEGDPVYTEDDREHYFRSFCAFMDLVNPKYAVPFASNHCHLHSDVYELNSYISNPVQLRDYVAARRRSDWSFALMLPGSTWTQASGFSLASESCYLNLVEQLKAYRERVTDKLVAYSTYENAVKIDDKIFQRFAAMFKGVRLPRAAHGDIRITVLWPDGRGVSVRLNLPSLQLDPISFTPHSEPHIPNMIFPAVVFRDAVVKNMFHHAAISKRCKFLARNACELNRLHEVMSVLEGVELGRYPWSNAYMKRLIGTYVRRWRELFVYAHALWLTRVRRKPMYLAEESILRGEF